MKVSYYPGCSLEHSAKDYEESIEATATLLDVQLEEVPDWNCCGATAAHSINEQLAIALPDAQFDECSSKRAGCGRSLCLML